jgi:hypothetical protein
MDRVRNTWGSSREQVGGTETRKVHRSQKLETVGSREDSVGGYVVEKYGGLKQYVGEHFFNATKGAVAEIQGALNASVSNDVSLSVGGDLVAGASKQVLVQAANAGGDPFGRALKLLAGNGQVELSTKSILGVPGGWMLLDPAMQTLMMGAKSMVCIRGNNIVLGGSDAMPAEGIAGLISAIADQPLEFAMKSSIVTLLVAYLSTQTAFMALLQTYFSSASVAWGILGAVYPAAIPAATAAGAVAGGMGAALGGVSTLSSSLPTSASTKVRLF